MRVKRYASVALALAVTFWVQGEPVHTQFAKPVIVVQGSITNDTTWSASNYYVLRGAVFVREPARLTIEPGTEIFGEFATNGTLIVAQGAQIIADGTAAAPIVFTSDQPIGARGRGDWGGLIINGRAPLNVPGGEAIGEGDTGVYGGSQPNDNSGILRYVRVEFAGTEFSPDNELNGIAFQGVGNGTTVDYVMVKANKDDGFEFFGGTVDAKHLISHMTADDSFDWTDGWTGKGQFWIAQQRGDDADQGIEADNNGDNNNLTPRSNPTLYNLTLVGDPDRNEGSESDIGILLREGTSVTIRNSVVIGFKGEGLEVDDPVTYQQIASGAMTIGSSFFFNNGLNFSTQTDSATGVTPAAWAASSQNVMATDPMLTRPYSHENPSFVPGDGSPVTTARVEVPPNDGFFEVTTYIGAVGPEGTPDWTASWVDWTNE